MTLQVPLPEQFDGYQPRNQSKPINQAYDHSQDRPRCVPEFELYDEIKKVKMD